MTSPSPAPAAPGRRGRGKLIALFVMFFGTMLLAGVLRFSGWQPAGHRNNGELLSPPIDLRAQAPRLADGSTYAWRPSERTWRIVLAPRAGCAPACVATARDIDKVWQLLGHNASKVDVLWIGAPPEGLPPMPALRVLQDDPALRAALPGVDAAGGTPVYVIDPNGFVILRYAPCFDAGGLRQDLAKLLKLM
jgi:hypothetical protein